MQCFHRKSNILFLNMNTFLSRAAEMARGRLWPGPPDKKWPPSKGGPTLAQRFFLGLANAKCEKTREEKGKTSGEFVSDSWFG
jgi:hypothetical protein